MELYFRVMLHRLVYYLLLNQFCLNLSHCENLECQLTSNIGNVFHSVANLQDRLTINCSSINGNKTKFVKWKKDGKLLNTSSSTFSKNNVTREDAGRYECTLINDDQRYETCFVSVKVNTPPQITNIIVKALTEEMVEISCNVSGYPQPTIKWYKNGHGYQYFWGKTVSPVGNQRYLFNVYDTYQNDGANYTCNVTNENGWDLDTRIYFSYTDSKCPKVDDPGVHKINIDLGESKSLLCNVVHPDKYRGSYHILPRHEDDNHIYTYTSLTDGKQSINYTILNAAKSDAGLYRCRYNMTTDSNCNPSVKIFHVFVREPSSMSARRKRNVHIAIAVSFGVAIVGLGLLLLIHHLRKNRLKSKRFYDSLPELRWDVFVSYCSKDFTWVKELCETLEQPPFNLILCLHQRDWELGHTVLDNMADSVYCSYKTLLIISRNYVDSSYCMQELQLALNCETGTRNGNRDTILLIKIDDVSLKKLPKALRQKSYLDFSNSEERKHFKKKLLKALPRRESTEGLGGDSEISQGSACQTIKLADKEHLVETL